MIDLLKKSAYVDGTFGANLNQRTYPQWTKTFVLIELYQQLRTGVLSIKMTGVPFARKKALDRDGRSADTMDLDKSAMQRIQPLRWCA